jgi:two-component system chemotaxis sensor kinase CheA
MKAYPPSLFERWPDDVRPERLPAGPRLASLFRGLYDHTCNELSWLTATVKHIKQQEDEDVFDQLYRRNHILYGFAAILGLPKATHLLAILDFTFDYAREIETFEPRSMDYVVQLLINTTRSVLDDFQSVGRSERDLADVIEECKTYLDTPFQQCLAPPQPRPAAPVPRATVEAEAPPMAAPKGTAPAVPVTSAAELAQMPPAAVTIDNTCDDEPEELDIPVDKVGLVSDFCEECRENLGQIGYQLIELEDSDTPLPVVNELFRSVHTVKGGARLLKIRKMEALTHQLESLLDQVRKGARPVSSDLIDVLLDGKKLLEDMVDEVASCGPIRTRIGPALQTLAALQNDTTPVPTVPPAALVPMTTRLPAQTLTAEDESAKPATVEARPKATLSTESIRVPTAKLDDVLNTASEVFITRIRLQHDVAAISSAIKQFKQTLHHMSELDTQVILNRLAEANRRLIDDLRVLLTRKNGYITPNQLAPLVNRFHTELSAEIDMQGLSAPQELTLSVLAIEEMHKHLQKNVELLEQLSARLQTGAMNFRMVPTAHVFDRFPTQVRDMGRQVGKRVRLDVSGADTELDKVLINQLADPLLHLLRNAVDHGIEPVEERRALGKPETGRIALRAYYHGSYVVIEVADDGRGIHVDKVLAKALERGLVEAERAASLTKQEILEFIFEPGFSTASQVSTLSGRGVGMDVVKTAISQVQGTITIDSVLQAGTTIRMQLPLTLAVVGILLVEERVNQFAFPVLQVEEILTIDRRDLKQFSGSIVYSHRSQTLPVTTLSSLLDFPPSTFADDTVSLVILTEGDKRIGVLVDRVLGRQEVLSKNLGSLIKKVPFVMGCTILSDSRLVLILNVWEIVHTRAEKPLLTSLAETEHIRSARKPHTVLIVDDSSIQRQNLSAILSHAGYKVETADSGFEALKCIRHKRYAAFCVDIAMPLMDGFEFVERLRRLPGHQETPVFFITSYTAQQERDRAASLGGHAFFAKPVDADMLVETVDKYCLHTAADSADTTASQVLSLV